MQSLLKYRLPGGFRTLAHHGPRELVWKFCKLSTSTRSSGKNPEKKNGKPLVIGVGGPSGSGKTLITSILQETLEKRFRSSVPLERELKVVRTSLDVFYRPLTPTELKLHEDGKINFDLPEALDDSLMESTLGKLIEGKEDVQINGYDYSTCQRTQEGTVVHSPPFDFVILEGTLALYFKSLRKYFDLKVYVDEDLDICLARRLIRDQAERGRTVEHIIKQWINTVKPASVQFCIPTKEHADLVLKGDVYDEESLSLLVNYLLQRQINLIPSKHLFPFSK